jgi:hypothetical protein
MCRIETQGDISVSIQQLQEELCSRWSKQSSKKYSSDRFRTILLTPDVTDKSIGAHLYQSKTLLYQIWLFFSEESPANS